jgi:hypothetical protein
VSDLPTAANIKEIVSLFAPGMILLWAYSRVKAGPTPEFRDRLVSYAIASTAYFSAISPLFYVPEGMTVPQWLWTIWHYAFLPLTLGWGIAYSAQRGWEYDIAKFFKLQFSHHIPAAWDFTFSQMKESTYILATLKDGSQVGGLMGAASFASSSKDERDLLIEDVWNVNAKNEWTQAVPVRAALLCGGDINYIEIFKGDS